MCRAKPQIKIDLRDRCPPVAPGLVSAPEQVGPNHFLSPFHEASLTAHDALCSKISPVSISGVLSLFPPSVKGQSVCSVLGVFYCHAERRRCLRPLQL